MRLSRYCTAALLTASMLTADSVLAGQRIDGPASFRVFLQGRLVGAEDVIVRRSETEVIISGSGRLGAPLDFTTRRIEIRYDQQWRPHRHRLPHRQPSRNKPRRPPDNRCSTHGSAITWRLIKRC